jgi:hypothetical protein
MANIIQRENPLVDHLNNIARINAESGTRAEGGAGAAIVSSEPPAVAGGVSLPPAEPLSPEEELELKALWEADVAERVARNSQATPGPIQPIQLATQNIGPARGTPLTDFAIFDLQRGVLIATNGEEFPLSPDDVKGLKAGAFRVAVAAINNQLTTLANGLGIKVALSTETANGKDSQEVPPVPGDEASK